MIQKLAWLWIKISTMLKDEWSMTTLNGRIVLTVLICLLVLCVTGCENLKSISRGDRLLESCHYAIVYDDRMPVSELDKANELNKVYKDHCDKKFDQLRKHQ